MPSGFFIIFSVTLIEIRHQDGTVQSRGYYGGKHKGQKYWTGDTDTIFGVSAGEACNKNMEIRTIEGHEFLIIESGGFTPDYHCGYNVHVRKQRAKP